MHNASLTKCQSLIRSAKSGSDWTQNEFRAYNITVQLQDAATFFCVDPLPQPAVAQEVLTTLDVDDMILNDNYKFLHCMVLAMNPVPTEESAVDDLAVHLLKLLGYLQAIAAFQMNNFRRERLLGSSPTFYKIPVTTELAEAVALGEYLRVPNAHLPTVPRPARRWSEGMKPLANRVHILQCYEALKPFVNWYVLYGSCVLINLMAVLEFRL
ncbi:uncharacterized protein C8R40DRAFT_1169507 [Lentinula edodes]|uniref:uncharacterized protein n=1 Tax=Lentinula edodes TaxID=5353 RepID=UPI001E8EC139|nr:uncharacterized protein C8R40DRAFT_1169507 [Lentinula edodes]KAH7876386.1 hypothetical protein C8R40DRAFT_1169507 [Lentinula edodes]